MNFVRDVVDAAPPEATALIELTRAGERRLWTFGEVSAAAARFAGHLQRLGVGQGDVVVIWLGNRAEWVLSMLACFRIGAVAAACPEQLRAKDLRQRLDVVSPAVIVADERNRDELRRAGPPCPVVWAPDDAVWRREPPAAAADLDPEDPCLVTFTSGTSGVPKAVVHVQRYLDGQRLQARHWLAAGRGDVVWCTASTGWSKSARNAFVAPWLGGATAVVHDARFDPHQRLEVIQQEAVTTLCMSPTEYRIVVKRAEVPPLPSLRSCVADGYRIGPFEVESALTSHPAVEEAAAVAAPDDERGAIVRAVVVLRSGHEPSDELRTALQAHVKAQTAPYKYPRRIDFVDHLPKTTSGKVQRAALGARS